MVEEFEPLSKKKNIGGESVPGEQNFERNFSEQVLQKIIEHNFRKQTPEKITYLKPTKAALFGLNLRFQSMDQRQEE